MIPPDLIIVLIVIFGAMLLRAILGFGDALIAMPLLSLVLGLTTTTPLVGLIQLTMTVMLLFVDRKNIEIGPLWKLVLASFVGIPLGAFLLLAVPEWVMRIILGAFLMFVGGVALFNIQIRFPDNTPSTLTVGFVNGVIGGAYNLIGPLIVMFCATKQWNPTKFRGMLTAYFGAVGSFIVATHYWQGYWTEPVITYYLYALPVAALAFLLGNLIHHKLNPDWFRTIVNLFLFIMGGYLIYQGFTL
ncbi:MAG: sulfite exporter TauE/SafE family protein [Chloroflexota bacterium]